MEPGCAISNSPRGSIPHEADCVRELAVVCGHGAALAGGDDLARVEGEAGERAETATRAPPPLGSERSGCILEHRQAVRKLLDAHRPAEKVDRDDRLRPWAHLELRRVEVHRLGVDVDEHRLRAGEGDDVRRRREGVGRNQHLVARTDPEGEHGEVERRGSRRDRDRVLGPARRGEPPLELVDLRSHGQLPALEHLGHGLCLRGPDVGPREPDQVNAGLRSRYQAIVRARPSSRSTFASNPSTSRAFSTFGIRSSTSA